MTNAIKQAYRYFLAGTISLFTAVIPEGVQSWFRNVANTLGIASSGIQGLAAGAGLINTVQQKINQVTETVDRTRHQVNETINTVQNSFNTAKNAINNLWESIKNGFQSLFNGLFSFSSTPNEVNHQDDEKEKETETLSSTATTQTSEPQSPSMLSSLLNAIGMGEEQSSETNERNDDPLMAPEILDTANSAMDTVKSGVSWLWNKVRGNSTPVVVSTAQAAQVNQQPVVQALETEETPTEVESTRNVMS